MTTEVQQTEAAQFQVPRQTCLVELDCGESIAVINSHLVSGKTLGMLAPRVDDHYMLKSEVHWRIES